MSQYWLIAVPNENKNVAATREKLLSRTRAKGLCDVYDWQVPTKDLLVGTLDQLMALSDELAKVDTFVDATAKKFAKAYSDLVKIEGREYSKPDPKATNASTSSKDKDANLRPVDANDKPIPLDVSVIVQSGREETKATPDEYLLKNWKWDVSRLSTKRTLQQLTEQIYKNTNTDDETLKSKMSEYNELKNTINNIDKKETGSLLSRPLAPYVDKRDFVQSTYLTTLLLVVPKSKEQEFLASYQTLELEAKDREAEKLKEQQERDAKEAARRKADEDAKPKEQQIAVIKAKEDEERKKAEAAKKQEERQRKEKEEARRNACLNIVPGSAKKLSKTDGRDAEDEHVLYRIVVMRKGADSYRNLCRDKRWIVRPFDPNSDEEKSQAGKKKELEVQKQKLWNFLVNWVAVHFSDAYTHWIHIKAIRVFVESVLRYGLPVDFQAVIIKPKKGSEKKLREALHELYAKLAGDASLADHLEGADADMAGLGGSSGEFYPYVFTSLTTLEDR
jgi:hypothetical protein